MRLFSETIIFVGICLIIISVIYGVQDAFISDGTSAGSHGQTRARLLAPIQSWSFDEDTKWLPPPVGPAGPVVAPARTPPPSRPAAGDSLEEGDAFFDAKFQSDVRLFEKCGSVRGIGFKCLQRPPHSSGA